MRRYIITEKSRKFAWTKVVTRYVNDGLGKGEHEVMFRTKYAAKETATFLTSCRGDVSIFEVQEVRFC